jgi:hypothetical protein
MTRPRSSQHWPLATGPHVHWLQEDERRGRLQLRRAVLPPAAAWMRITCWSWTWACGACTGAGDRPAGRGRAPFFLFASPHVFFAFHSLLQWYWLWIPICKQQLGLCVNIPINRACNRNTYVLFSSWLLSKFYYEKEDFPSHRNVGTCINVDEIKN